MKKFIFSVLLVFAGAEIAYRLIKKPIFPSHVANEFKPTVVELKSVVELVPFKIPFSDILKIKGYGCLYELLTKGEVGISIDLDKMTLSVDEENKVCRISLPLPRVSWAKVDHHRTYVFESDSPWGMAEDLESKVWNFMWREAQNIIETTAVTQDHLRIAMEDGESFIRGIYELDGWKAEIVWQGEVVSVPSIANGEDRG